MTENKLISSKAVIAKIMADNNMSENDIKIADMSEWIGEGMEKIGAILQLERKTAVIPITNHLALLPCDLHRLDQVGYSSSSNAGWMPMRKTTGSFVIPQLKQACDKCEDNNSLEMFVHDNAMIPFVKNMFNLVDDRAALDILNLDSNLRKTLSVLINQYTVPSNNGIISTNGNMQYGDLLLYMTKPGYIVTIARDGFAKIAYYAIVTDEDALPMIPDNVSYTEALYWYVTMKLEFPNYKNGKLPRLIFYDIKNSWNFYRKQAYGEAMMPSGADELHTIQNTWLKLYPEIDDHDTFFASTGASLNIYNNNF